MTQCDVIFKAMLENEQKKEWLATDFQSGKYFVGYEASPRMSELAKKYPDIFIVGKKGRFRTLAIDRTKDLSRFLKQYELI